MQNSETTTVNRNTRRDHDKLFSEDDVTLPRSSWTVNVLPDGHNFHKNFFIGLINLFEKGLSNSPKLTFCALDDFL